MARLQRAVRVEDRPVRPLARGRGLRGRFHAQRRVRRAEGRVTMHLSGIGSTGRISTIYITGHGRRPAPVRPSKPPIEATALNIFLATIALLGLSGACAWLTTWSSR